MYTKWKQKCLVTVEYLTHVTTEGCWVREQGRVCGWLKIHKWQTARIHELRTLCQIQREMHYSCVHAHVFVRLMIANRKNCAQTTGICARQLFVPVGEVWSRCYRNRR